MTRPALHRKQLAFGRFDLLCVILLACIIVFGTFFIRSHPAIRITVLVLAAAVLVTAIWIAKRLLKQLSYERLISYVFPIVLVSLGAIYALYFTPGSVPDEPYHHWQSYQYANLLTPGTDVLSARNEEIAWIDSDASPQLKEISVSRWRSSHESFSLFATEEGSDYFPLYQFDVSSNPPQTKLASAVGIMIGRSLGLSAAAVFYLGRFFNLLCSSILIIAAIQIMPIGKNIMRVIALLPITLHLMASFSYDAPIIGFAFLYLALLLKLTYDTGHVSYTQMGATLATGILLAPCKIVYLVLSFVVLFIPQSRFRSRKEELAFKLMILVVPTLVALAARVSLLLNMTGAQQFNSQLDLRGAEQGTYYTFSDLITHPLSTASLFLRTFVKSGDVYFSSMLGGNLGWMQSDIAATVLEVTLLFTPVALSTLTDLDDESVLPTPHRCVLFALFIAGMFAVMLGLTLGWTFNTEHEIQGVQGRYFLPILPALLLSLRGKALRATCQLSLPLIVFLGSFNCMYLARIAFTVLGG